MVLGQVVEGLNRLSLFLQRMDEQNRQEHDRIVKRLDDGDKLFFWIKVSKCTLDWLDSKGLIKYTLMFLLFFAADWVSRYLYWDIYPKP